MIPREQIQAFLISIGHEPASKDQAQLCLAEAIVNALGEVTPAMASEGMHRLSALPVDAGWPTLARQAGKVYAEMFAARFPPHVPKEG